MERDKTANSFHLPVLRTSACCRVLVALEVPRRLVRQPLVHISKAAKRERGQGEGKRSERLRMERGERERERQRGVVGGEREIVT